MGLEERAPGLAVSLMRELTKADGLLCILSPGHILDWLWKTDSIPTMKTAITPTHTQHRKAMCAWGKAVLESVDSHYHLVVMGFKKATCNLCIQSGPRSLLWVLQLPEEMAQLACSTPLQAGALACRKLSCARQVVVMRPQHKDQDPLWF